jgi:hypothetical protein
MVTATGSTALLIVLAVLAGLILVMPRALAVLERRDFDDEGKTSGKTKSCPKGQRQQD